MKKEIHKLELNVLLADKILEVLNIHSKEAKVKTQQTNLTGRIPRIHAMYQMGHLP